MTSPTLFSPLTIGDLNLPNRTVLAPLTRCRASEGSVPNPMMADYYVQRASAGLMITEGAQIAPEGQGYPATPGIYSDEQVAGWRLVTDAVHRAGGRIFLQLWHVGRVSHPSFQPGGTLPVAPSAIAPEGEVATYEGMKPYVAPRALETDELPGIVALYRKAAQNAKDAGFDGVEVHGANGYLLDQFLRDGTNRRTDAYGGSIENRARLPLEVLEAVLSIWPSRRVGVRLSPSGTINSMSDSDPAAHFGYFVEKLNAYDLAYVHIVEPMEADIRHGGPNIPGGSFRPIYTGTLMLCGEYDGARADAAVQGGAADLVAFGRPFIANPDLPRRLQENAPLNTPDPTTFYGGDEHGYLDYPALEEAPA
ncbi:alkene reductase [Varunaivibrio sulfuroxidans]|uniref:N-ethylmaleimide reductase n=1 Tax=Varunaivibrio sulfuroxidans TaxID=1773489 RepID=A0A4R3JF73_9PROT|nr:alkene reductase [Varunaivibrio sulfuroxidans]TCS64769.1 N-ethylmaleimide reductase [Varunaivibrio sulfuroxidans]WES29926.1 alkene reductase [Varunaivibrio sulfuroxidans]